MLKGIDISYWQGDINFGSVEKTQDFIIIRSSYGNGYIDEKFETYRSECRRLNIPHGFYHYAYPQYNSPEDEAEWFLHTVGALTQNEILILDFEENYGDPVGWSKRFLDRISSRLNGYLPMIYLNKHTVQSWDWSPVVSKGYGLWLAYWDYDPDGTFDVPYWNLVAMRQYSNNGSINGISGRVDENVFYGDLDQFKAYGVKVEENPCEKTKLENEQLKSENKLLQEENIGLQDSLDGLNSLYKKLLDEDKIEDEEMAQLLKDQEELTNLYAQQTDRVVDLDRKNQELEKKVEGYQAEISRLKLQKFTVLESLRFLIAALKGVDRA